jgi:hypothetical protein
MSGVSIRASGRPDPTDHRQRWEWLKVIHAANEVEDGFFGAPVKTGDWWAGGCFEEYAHARVIIDDDRSARIVALDEHGDDVLRRAAALLGIHHHEPITPKETDR